MAKAFTIEDCALFQRYPSRVRWGEVTQSDKDAFKSVRQRLKDIATDAVETIQGSVPFRGFASLYEANGRSVTDVWCCVHPSSIENKSYALQVALIISARGGEMCFCVGAGESQTADPDTKRNLESKLNAAKDRLRTVPKHISGPIQTSLNASWSYHRSWRSEPNQKDFNSLADWLAYASTPEGNKASISTYFTPEELQALGEDVSQRFNETVVRFKPILEHVYGVEVAKSFWIFQGNPELFDLDTYLSTNSEIRWRVTQYGDQLHENDEVLIWKSGPLGGVIAQCIALSGADADISEDAATLWKKEPEINPNQRRCRLKVVEKFPGSPIPRDAIKASLPDLPIFKFAQNTNYPISESAYRRILEMKKKAKESARVDFSGFHEIEQAISSCGLRVAPGFLRRLIASLASKPFVILTGTSGTGKTKVAQAVARLLTLDRSTYRLIPVGADWTGNDNIIGYPDGLDATAYIGKPALELVWHAAENPDLPHFLILDEMNLSHVERYFADLLSAIESREEIPLYSGSVRTLAGKELPRALVVPTNVFIVGTVNVDETTYMFSPKVLDRANVIEFRVEADDIQNYFKVGKTPDLSQIIGKGEALGNTLVRAVTQPVECPTNVVERFQSEMILFFNVLKPHGVEFGYRVVHEANRFLYFFHELADESEGWFEKGFDAIIVQKLLPKLHGQRTRLAPVLRKLWFLCVHPQDARGTDLAKRLDEVSRSTERSVEPVSNVPVEAPYPISAEKIARMWRLLNENGFTSFAEA